MRAPLYPMPTIPSGEHPGAFGAIRHQHVHTGVDLYAPYGCPVTAMESGRIVRIDYFTGSIVNMPWWNNTMAVYVEGETGTFCYGEIQPLVTEVGANIQEGDIVGYVVTVLKKYKGRPMSMLHIELYDHGYTDDWGEWKIGEPRPKHLQDPTSFLEKFGTKVSFDPYIKSAELYQKDTKIVTTRELFDRIGPFYLDDFPVENQSDQNKMFELFNELPEHIQKEAVANGCSDTVFRDQAFVFLIHKYYRCSTKEFYERKLYKEKLI